VQNGQIPIRQYKATYQVKSEIIQLIIYGLETIILLNPDKAKFFKLLA